MGHKLTRARFDDTAGVPSIASAEILFSDAAQEICSVPLGAIVTRVWAEILTAFNAGTTNVLVVGVTGTTDKYMAAADIAEGTPGPSATKGPFAAEAAAVTVKASYTQTGTAATAGKARVYVEFVRNALNG